MNVRWDERRVVGYTSDTLRRVPKVERYECRGVVVGYVQRNWTEASAVILTADGRLTVIDVTKIEVVR